MDKLIQDIIASLNDLADAKRIAFAKKSYPTQLKVIGVTNPSIKIVLKALKQTTTHFEPNNRLKLAQRLVDTNIFECQQLAYEFLDKDKKALAL